MPDVTLPVPLGDRGYSIEISSGLLRRIASRLRVLTHSRRVTVVTDERVARLHAPALSTSLDQAGIGHTLIIVPAGEASKSSEMLGEIYDVLAADHHDRAEPIIALGGGMVGDLAGFAAATWLRGVPFVQCPTTLEAAIDAAIGGKSAINHASGKNLIGAFHQPIAVFIDPLCLSTLPDRDYIAGLAESVKHTLLAGEDFLAWHEKNAVDIRGRSPDVLTELIRRNCEIKITVVVADEREQDANGVGRAALNLGHTFGHAIESLSAYELRHGEAVSIGLVAEMELAVRCCGFSDASRRRLEQLLSNLGLPLKAPGPFDKDDLIRRLGSDKKVQGDKVRFVLPARLGELTWLNDPPEANLKAALDRIQ